jgi:hypothetical protein
MMHIQPWETIMVGQWIVENGRVVADQTSQRIARLIKENLVEVGRDASGWDVLYRDPEDDRLWELIYPHSEQHGGGPPELRALSVEKAKQKYLF